MTRGLLSCFSRIYRIGTDKRAAGHTAAHSELNVIGAKGAAEFRVNGSEIGRRQPADGSAYVRFGQDGDFVEPDCRRDVQAGVSPILQRQIELCRSGPGCYRCCNKIVVS